MVVGDLVQLGRRHHFPGGQRAVHHTLGDGFGHLRRRHAHRGGAEGFHQLGGGAAGSAQLEVLQIDEGGHRLATGVDVHAAVAVDGQHLEALEVVLGVLLVVLPDDRVTGPGARRKHEGQLHGLDARELAR
ncbi:hypothetical protein D3C72_1992240 [compost metagenome]